MFQNKVFQREEYSNIYELSQQSQQPVESQVEEQVLLKYIDILISLFASISITSVYSQELKEYESELLKNKSQYPDDWEENMKEQKTTTSD